MAKKKKIHDFLPEKKKTVLIQAHVDVTLASKVRVKIKKDGIKLQQFFEACIRKYLEE